MKDKSINEQHCEIFYEGDEFYLSDLSSSEGTWISVENQTPLFEGAEFRIKDSIIKITEINTATKTFILSLPKINGAEKLVAHGDTYRIGKCKENELVIENLQDLHAAISFSGETLVLNTLIQDGSYFLLEHFNIANLTTNRVLIRLKGFKKQKLKHNDTISMGNMDFTVILNQGAAELPAVKPDKLEEEAKAKMAMCGICQEHEVNAVFLPCKHCILCTECARKLPSCPVCKTRIADVLEISPS